MQCRFQVSYSCNVPATTMSFSNIPVVRSITIRESSYSCVISSAGSCKTVYPFTTRRTSIQGTTYTVINKFKYVAGLNM